jgi:hypothetical protein
MAWSTPVAEPIGAISGVIAGEIASHYSDRLAKSLNLDRQTAKMLTTTTAHFVASVVTKGAINVAAGDPIAAGINPVTAAMTSTAHGATKAYVVPKVRQLISQPKPRLRLS